MKTTTTTYTGDIKLTYKPHELAKVKQELSRLKEQRYYIFGSGEGFYQLRKKKPSAFINFPKKWERC